MIKYASFILLVCRNEYTRKDVFTDVLNLFQTNSINNYDIVFNDLNLKKAGTDVMIITINNKSAIVTFTYY